MADQEQERAEVHEASGSAKDRRGPKRGKQSNRLPNKGASRITTAAADILNKVKSAGVAQRQLCQYLPITSRGFGFVSTKVWEYLEDQRRQVIQQIDYFSPTRLWRLSLALAYVKAFNGSKHAHIGVENPDGFYPGDMRQPPTEVVLSLARIERILGNSFDIGTVALPTYPRSITLKTIEKMSDAECTLAVMSLIGEIPVNGIISSGYDYRKRAIGKSTVELRWTTALDLYFGK